MGIETKQPRPEIVEVKHAWLVTWVTLKDGAFREALAAVFPGRKNASFIADRVRELYVAGRDLFGVNVACAKSTARAVRICEPQIGRSVNGVPTRDQVVVLTNPGLHARVVSQLRVEHTPFSNIERVSWTEPGTWRWIDKAAAHVEKAEPGKRVVVEVDARSDTWPTLGRPCTVVSRDAAAS
jgi:hypothetical protein